MATVNKGKENIANKCTDKSIIWTWISILNYMDYCFNWQFSISILIIHIQVISRGKNGALQSLNVVIVIQLTQIIVTLTPSIVLFFTQMKISKKIKNKCKIDSNQCMWKLQLLWKFGKMPINGILVSKYDLVIWFSERESEWKERKLKYPNRLHILYVYIHILYLYLYI